MRYYGVIQRSAGAYNHIVRNMLGQLDARMKVTGQRFGVWGRHLDDGTIIRVQIIKNGVSPIYRATVTAPEEATQAILISGPVLEHGMLVHELPPQSVPIDVHHTDWSRGYVAGAGTSTPVQQDNQYLIGPRGTYEGEIAWSFNPMYWQSDPYKSQVWVDQSQWDNFWPIEVSLQPNRWAGLMRLWVQCLLGANRPPSEAFAGAYPLRSGEDGLVRLWDSTLDTYQYWFIRADIGGGGVWANACTPSTEGQAVLEWLNAHKRGAVSLSDDTRRLYDAWVLRDLTVGAGAEILDASEMAGVWENNASSVAHGWAYSRQRIGSASEDVAKASIVTHGVTTVGDPTGTSRFHAQHYHLEFSVSNGAISIVLTRQEGPTDWAMIVSQGPMWYPTHTMTEYQHWEHPANHIGDETTPEADVPFYCFWTNDQEVMCRFNMAFRSVNDVDTGNYGSIEICGGSGGGSKTYKNLQVLTYGGPYIAGVTPASGTIDQGTRKDKTFTVGKIGEVVKGWPGSTSYGLDPAGKQFCEIPEGCWPDGWYGQEPFCDSLRNDVYGEFTYDLVSATETEDEYSTNLWSLERPLIITTDPEAVYSVFHQRVTGSHSATVWAFTSNNLSATLTTGGRWRWETTQDEFKMRFGSRGGYYYGSNPGTGMGPTGSNSSGELNPPTSETNTPIDEIQDSAYLVTADQTRNLPIVDDGWASYFGALNMGTQGITVDSNRSYYNGAGYYATSKSAWVTTDELPFTYGDGILIPIGAV